MTPLYIHHMLIGVAISFNFVLTLAPTHIPQFEKIYIAWHSFIFNQFRTSAEPKGYLYIHDVKTNKYFRSTIVSIN